MLQQDGSYQQSAILVWVILFFFFFFLWNLLEVLKAEGEGWTVMETMTCNGWTLFF